VRGGIAEKGKPQRDKPALHFGFEFGPAGVESVHGLLGLFECDAGGVEFARVASDFRFVQSC
jgi:hypothetical protein